MKKESTNEDSWNSLFVRSDTAIEATAAELGVSKGQILDKEGGNMAVKAALAETQVIERTKQYLKDQGVDVAKFSGNRSGSKRSKTVIIVKIFRLRRSRVRSATCLRRTEPWAGSWSHPVARLRLLRWCISKRPVWRFVASLTNASSTFRSSSSGRPQKSWCPERRRKTRAMQRLRREELPRSLVKRPASQPARPSPRRRSARPSLRRGMLVTTTTRKTIAAACTSRTSAFRPPTMRCAGLFAEFRGSRRPPLFASGTPNFVRRNPRAPRTQRHCRWGTASSSLRSPRDARLAVSAKQDIVLDGHTLSLLKLSRRRTQEQKRAAGSKRKRAADGKSSSKLLARNIAFQANQRELRELFGAYGQLKKLRLPRKFDGTHRGFCFVEYLTEQAKSAKTALENTHFYGRHLVLEWAKADDTLEELRQKTKDAYDAAAEATEAGVKAAAPSSRGAALTTGMFSKRKRAKLGGSKG